MHRKAVETIEQYNMLPCGSRVIVGFSGGADSVALLSFLWEQRKEKQWELLACHVNHQLRGVEAERDEAFCREFCLERDIPLRVFRENIAEGAVESGKSIEEYAREVRYQRFQSLCDSDKDWIVTAHHANDLAETLLFHLVRGSGLKGMVGIPAKRGNIVRPLLFCERSEIEQYCEEKGLSYVIDSSNYSLKYSRNQIRHKVIPCLQEINPSFVKSAVRLSKQASIEEDYWEKQITAEQQRIQVKENTWKRAAFLELHSAVQMRIIAQWLEQCGAERSRKKVLELLELIQQGGTQELCQGKYLCVTAEDIRRKDANEEQPFFVVPLQEGKNRIFPGKQLEIVSINREKYKFFANNGSEDLKNVFDYDKMYGIAVIRQRLPGDTIQLAGSRLHKSFKKLLNEKKIPVEERSRLAVCCDEKGPLWLEGFGVRADVQPDSQSTKLMLIRVLKELSL